MSRLLVSLALPAAAIVAAALAQVGLKYVWPGVSDLPTVAVTADSYVTLLIMAALCFLSGRWIRRNTRTAVAAPLAIVAPLCWMVMVLAPTLGRFEHVAWSSPLTRFVLATAAAPLLGVIVGWGTAATGENRAPLA